LPDLAVTLQGHKHLDFGNHAEVDVVAAGSSMATHFNRTAEVIEDFSWCSRGLKGIGEGVLVRLIEADLLFLAERRPQCKRNNKGVIN